MNSAQISNTPIFVDFTASNGEGLVLRTDCIFGGKEAKEGNEGRTELRYAWAGPNSAAEQLLVKETHKQVQDKIQTATVEFLKKIRS